MRFALILIVALGLSACGSLPPKSGQPSGDMPTVEAMQAFCQAKGGRLTVIPAKAPGGVSVYSCAIPASAKAG